MSKIKTKAIKTLFDAGAHLVKLKDKAPFEKDWLNNPVPLPDAMEWLEGGGNHNLGFIPASLGLIGIDIDKPKVAGKPMPDDEARAIEEIFSKPHATVRTQSGGLHLLYRSEDKKIGNHQWRSGDIRGSKGCLVLWDPKAVTTTTKRVNGANLKLDEFLKHFAAEPTSQEGKWNEGTRNTSLFREALLAGAHNDKKGLKEAKAQAAAAGLPDKEISETSKNGWEMGEKSRKKKAASLAARKLTFVDPEPWPDEVDGAKLLTSVSKIIKKHMSMNKAQADAVALWIVLAWIHAQPGLEIAPFLNITAPTKRAGKATLLYIIKEFCPRPLLSTKVSPSVMFRVIEMFGPTFCMDELKLKGGERSEAKEELSLILNASQSRVEADVIRNVQTVVNGVRDWTPLPFNTWCPKVLCGIGGLEDATLDRCIQINLKRKPKTVKLPRWRNRDREEVKKLVRKLARWSRDNADRIVAGRDEVKLPESLNDLQQDSWEPIFSIAKTAGGNWPKLVQKACSYISGTIIDDVPLPELLLAHVRSAYRKEDGTDEDFLTSKVVIAALLKRQDGPWNKYNRGKEIDAYRLAKEMKAFGITPKQKKIDPKENTTHRGYFLTDIKPVADIYGSEELSIRYSATEDEEFI